MAQVNGSFASPSADATITAQLADPSTLLKTIYNGFTGWTAILALIIAAVAYDQST